MPWCERGEWEGGRPSGENRRVGGMCLSVCIHSTCSVSDGSRCLPVTVTISACLCHLGSSDWGL